MFKGYTYLLLLLASFGFLGLTSACRTKKPTKTADSISSATPEKKATSDPTEFDFYFVNGCSERMKGNLQEALKSFETCANLQPNNEAVHYELAMVQRMLGRNELALREAKIPAEKSPGNEWYQLLLIECYESLNYSDELIKTREKLVKQFPERNDFKQDLAYTYATHGQLNKAFKLYNELETQLGVQEDLIMNKVKLLKSLNKYPEAERELIRLVRSRPDDGLYRSYLADFYMETGLREKAKAVYDTLQIMDPDNPSVQLAMHDYYSMNGEQEKAFGFLKEAFSNAELDAASKASILLTYMDQAGNSPEFFARGKELSEILLKVHPEAPEANGLYAEFLLRENKSEKAAVYLTKAAYLNSANYATWDKLLLVDIDLARMDSLEVHSARASELFPNQAQVYYYNGYSNIQLKNYRKALEALQNGIGVVTNNNAMLLKFYSLAGDAGYYCGEYLVAYQNYTEALKIDPDNTYVLNNYAYFLSLRGDELEKAEKLSKRTLELKPEEKNYMDTYGWILFQQKNYTEAEKWLGRAASMEPLNPNILEHYGDALFRGGKPDAALLQWKLAQQSGGKNDALLEKIKCKCLREK